MTSISWPQSEENITAERQYIGDRNTKLKARLNNLSYEFYLFIL